MKKKLGDSYTGEEDFNFILTYFTNTDPRGLIILPIHRLVKLEEGFVLEAFKLKLKDSFDFEEIKDKTRFFFLMEKCGRSEHVIGMYKDKKYWLLRLKNIKILDKEMSARPKEYRFLDTAILNALIFNKLVPKGTEHSNNIAFSPYAEGLIKKADNGRDYISFFLNPVRVEQIMALALKGERMPPKSTYFYPKVLSGLLINKFQ